MELRVPAFEELPDAEVLLFWHECVPVFIVRVLSATVLVLDKPWTNDPIFKLENLEVYRFRLTTRHFLTASQNSIGYQSPSAFDFGFHLG